MESSLASWREKKKARGAGLSNGGVPGPEVGQVWAFSRVRQRLWRVLSRGRRRISVENITVTMRRWNLVLLVQGCLGEGG